MKFSRPVLYRFNPATKEYAGQTQSDIDHAALIKNELVFLPPAFTTSVKPPDAPKGSAVVWNGDDWDLIEDHRGEIWYTPDGVPIRITEIGNPEGELQREPPKREEPPVDPIALRKAKLTARYQEVVMLGQGFALLNRPVPKEIQTEQDELFSELKKLNKAVS